MKVYLIQTDNYWCAFDLGDPKGDKSVGVISRVYQKTGITEVLSTLDKHGIGLVAELADKLAIAEKRKADVEAMLVRLYAECDTGEHRGNGSQSGVAMPSWAVVEASRLLLGVD
ncbi:TPA: hypothetical protein ACHFNF_004502 [Enterobacter hormaechei]|uniref:hypothetical protein n=1 Tax=Enterobacter TaxID=547 RepID=UPI000797237F|nr:MULTISPECIES: hypothetical protein [Enterobacter]MDU1189435.1 hypothetical protein [Enterobacter sp.]CZW01597.1 Uncharacterised protein [Enterobacter hormaechei]